jgi:DNA primase
VAPYSLRALREATVSVPLEWGELASVRPFDHNVFNVPDRRSDPWMKLLDEPFRLPKV